MNSGRGNITENEYRKYKKGKKKIILRNQHNKK